MIKVQLLIDNGPEIRHRTGLYASDPFFYIKKEDGTELVYFDAREYDVQKKALEAMNRPIQVERLEPYRERADKDTGSPYTRDQKMLLEILLELKVGHVEVSGSLPVAWARILEETWRTVTIVDFAAERQKKTPRELELMKKAQKSTEKAFKRVREILRESRIEGEQVLWRQRVLTSELLKFEAGVELLREGLSSPARMIISSGEQTAYSHDEGSGPIRPHSFIIVDIYPRDDRSGQFADMTRTFCKGYPTPQMQRMYDAVRDVQESAIRKLVAGSRGKDAYKEACELFAALGFPETGPEKGFSHGLGHSLGLELHESPNLYEKELEPGTVVTIEPGLYYPGMGGVRIEDVVIITENGAENITSFDKEFVIL